MDVNLKGEIKGLIAEHCEKFNLDTNSLFIPTFVASSGYRNKVSAVDGALVCGTMLEDTVSPSLNNLNLRFTIIIPFNTKGVSFDGSDSSIL